MTKPKPKNLTDTGGGRTYYAALRGGRNPLSEIVNIQVTPEQQTALFREAQKRKTTVRDLIIDALRKDEVPL